MSRRKQSNPKPLKRDDQWCAESSCSPRSPASSVDDRSDLERLDLRDPGGGSSHSADEELCSPCGGATDEWSAVDTGEERTRAAPPDGVREEAEEEEEEDGAGLSPPPLTSVKMHSLDGGRSGAEQRTCEEEGEMEDDRDRSSVALPGGEQLLLRVVKQEQEEGEDGEGSDKSRGRRGSSPDTRRGGGTNTDRIPPLSSSVDFPQIYFSSKPEICSEERFFVKQCNGYYCQLCGIRFSSRATLEAHQAYYCSRRLFVEEGEVTLPPPHQSYVRRNGAWSGAAKTDAESAAEEEDGRSGAATPDEQQAGRQPPPPPPPPPPSALAKSASAKGRTNSKRSGYSPQEGATIVAHQQAMQMAAAASAVPPSARYCANCDIQFSSAKTFQVHKQFYCSTRHVLKASPAAPASNKATAGSTTPVDVAAVEAKGGAISRNLDVAGSSGGRADSGGNVMVNSPVLGFPSGGPVILVPCSYISGSGMMPATAGLLVPNGSGLFPAFTLLTSPPPATSGASVAATSPRTPHSAKQPRSPSPAAGAAAQVSERPPSHSPTRPRTAGAAESGSGEQPLDLSIRKLSTESTLTEAARRVASSGSSETSVAERTLRVSSASPTFASASAQRVYVTNASGNMVATTSSRAAELFAAFEVTRGGLQLYQQQLAPPVTRLVSCHPNASSGSLASSLSHPPPPMVKQGSNRCADCGVVFYLKENYLVHKRHYCSQGQKEATGSGSPSRQDDDSRSPPSRRRRTSSAVADSSDEDSRRATLRRAANTSLLRKVEAEEGGGSETTKTPTPQPQAPNAESERSSPRPHRTGVDGASPGLSAAVAVATGTKLHPHFACSSCGIRFTSIGNLQAHQTYYCPKLTETAPHHQHHHHHHQGASASRAVLDKIATSTSASASLQSSKVHHSPLANILLCGRCQTPFQVADEDLITPTLIRCPACDATGGAMPPRHSASEHSAPAAARAYRCTICGYRGNTLRGLKTHIRMHLERGSDMQEECFIAALPNTSAAPPPINGTDSFASDPHGGASNDSSSSTDGAPSSSSAQLQQEVAPPCEVADRLSTSLSSLHACDFCGYTSSYKGNVVRHVRLVHKELLPNISGGEDAPGESRSLPNGQRRMSEGDASPPSPAESNRSASSPPTASPRRSSSVAEWRSNRKVEENEEKEAVAGPASDNKDVGAPSPSAVSSADGERLSDAGEEPSVAGEGGGPSSTSPGAVPAKPTVAGVAAAAGAAGQKRSGPKYCKSCDISFTYLSTFIAHKKFYCASHACENLGRETSVQ